MNKVVILFLKLLSQWSNGSEIAHSTPSPDQEIINIYTLFSNRFTLFLLIGDDPEGFVLT